jgi:hypothetical protein
MFSRQGPWLRTSLTCLVCLLLVYGTCFYRYTHSDGICITFDDAPPGSYHDLKDWMERQDDISNVSAGQKGGLVVVQYYHTRSMFGRSPIPDIVAQCEALGFVRPRLASTNHAR